MAGNLKTGWVKVATSGKTVDGREIKKEWLKDMAESYDPEYFGALLWPDHLRRFGNMGKVLALKTDDAQEPKLKGEIHLYAILAPNDDLIYLNKRRQYVYTSIEVEKNFAGSGKTYLGGLAITDTPASLGTSELMFNSDSEKFIFRGSNIEFDELEADGKEKGFFSTLFNLKPKPTENQGEPMSPEQYAAFMDSQKQTQELLKGIAESFKAGGQKPEQDPKDNPAPKGGEGGGEKFATQDQLKELGETLKTLTGSVEKISTEFAELRKTPAGGTEAGGDEGDATSELL